MKLNRDKEMLAGIIRLRGIVALLPQSFFCLFMFSILYQAGSNPLFI